MVRNLIVLRCPFCKAKVAEAEEADGLHVIRHAAGLGTDERGAFLACPSCSRRIILESVKGGGFRISEFQNRTEWG